jgi:site-specific recombinase XerD
MGLSKRQQKAAKGKEPTKPVAAPMTLEKALEVFLLAQNAAGHSKATYEDYERVIGLFLRYMAEMHGYTAMKQITEADIVGWLAHLRNTPNRFGRPYSSRSIETYSRDVAVFFHWLVDHNHLKVNPMGKVKTPKVEKALIRVFTEDELERLDAACDRPAKGKSLTPDERKALAARDRAFLWLLLSTGIRLSEACGLLFSDIDWDAGMIYVRGKGAKERKVPFGKVARQHLNTYIQYWRGEPTEHDEHVFLNAFGNPLRKQAATEIFRRLKRVAGITDKRVSPHTCRHWFAVNAIKNGMPSTVLQSLLGHEELEMINTYVRLAEQDKRVLYTRYSPVDALEMHHSSKGRRERAREWRNARKRGKVKGDILD